MRFSGDGPKAGLGVLIASFLGCAFAFLLFHSASPASGEGSAGDVRALQHDLETIHNQIQDWTGVVESLHAQMEVTLELVRQGQTSVPVQRQAIPVLPQEPPASSEGSDQDSQAESGDRWTGVLDIRVAQLLVERGLTPFMPGVASPTRKAGEALRLAESRYHEVVAPVRDRFLKRLVTRAEYEAIADTEQVILTENTAETLRELELALNQLQLQEAPD